MKHHMPLISFLINCYNSENYLKECIESALSQSYKNLEIIIWDNRSTDNTALISKQFDDKRIKYYLSESHENLVNSRISAWKKITGEFVAIMDSDDLSYPNRLENQLSLIFKDKNLAVVGGGVEYINETGQTLSYRKFPYSKDLMLKKINYKFPMNNSSLFFDKKKIDEIGGYSKYFEFINDFELVYRVSKKYNLVNSNTIVSKNRIHNKSLSNTRFLLMQYELLNFLNKIKKENNSIFVNFLNFYERLKCIYRVVKYKLLNV